jgi:phosphatidylinositol glycan class B
MVYGGVELTWEWRDDYRIRSTLYPSYLALPFWLLKKLGLDYGYAVRTCPYIAHILLVIIYDSYLWRIGKLTVGKNSSRIAFLILFFARLYNEFMIRTFSNAVETVFQVIAFFYFLKVSNKFDKNIVLLTFLLTLSFMIRNTSPIGWPPLILIKIVKDRSWLPFILAFVFVFIPVAFLSVALDSYFYGDFPVITSLNFMRVNVSEGLSKYFGTSPFHFYIIEAIPFFFTVALPAVIAG